MLFIGLKRVKVRAARVGARLFAARYEFLEEVEDDCDDKEYERHGVPSEAGVFPVFDVMSARLMSQKRPATQKIRIWMKLLFSGGGIETMPRQKITCSGAQEYRVRRFFG